MTRHRMRLVEQLVEEDSGDFTVDAATPELAAGILVAAHDAARDRCEDLVVLPDGQSRLIEPTDIVRSHVFCVLLDEAGEEVREVEPDRQRPAANNSQPAPTEGST